jgi:magnesium-protoporphyrin O-methyltransferase
MDCCQCEGIESKFDQAYAAKKLEEYRQEGPKATTKQLIDALSAVNVEGMTLLDIGGGLGDIQHEMLKLGMSEAQNVEASLAYLEASRVEAERLGHAARVRFIHGNFVDLAQELDSADVVTLDRVICCYHDMVRLITLSSQKAKKLYGVVYPRDVWWAKLGIQLYYNSRNWLKRNPMRYFIHPKKAVEALLRENGFERQYHREMGAWQVVVFKRNAT